MPPFPFLPRQIAKPAQTRRWTVGSTSTRQVETNDKGKDKSVDANLGVNPRYSDEDFVILASLSLSDYALWHDPQLRRKWEWSIGEGGTEGCEWFFSWVVLVAHAPQVIPLKYILRNSSCLSGLDLDGCEIAMAKAVRSSGSTFLEIRMSFSTPAPSLWGRGDVGAYEIRRSDWDAWAGNSTREFTKSDWDDRTFYMVRFSVSDHPHRA
jgi:hypothetical protein